MFDFLSISKEAHEREIEKGLVAHIEKFLMELGAGFSFVGRQYHLTVSRKDYDIDLLFYHLKLRCFVAIELKAVEFEPEHAGKMNFYLSALDDLFPLKPTDKPFLPNPKRDSETSHLPCSNRRQASDEQSTML